MSSRGAAITQALLVVAAGVVGALAAAHLTDLAPYRYGGRAVLEGLPLYDAHDPVSGLPFTYPPFGAVVMVPLALMPVHLAAAVLTSASTAALAAVVVISLSVRRRRLAAWSVPVLVIGALALEPVWQNLRFGQINVLLMLAVLVDLTRPGRKYSGVLIGVAAGIKLTPLVFVVLLVLVGRRSAAARAVMAFGVTVALGFAVMPGQAPTYWSDRLLDGSRVGPPALAHNQSVYGALTRLLDGPPPTYLWLALAAPIAAAVLAVATAWWRRGDPMLAAGLGAVAMLLASPVSWSHHWVWCVPIALGVARQSRVAALAWTAVFVARPILWPPWGEGRETHWNALDHLVGNAYLLSALALAVWAAVRLARGPTVGDVSDADIQGRIKSLIEQEHELRQRLGAGEISSEVEHADLTRIEVELDQCWDLLRQRRARREFGQDPDEAAVRDAGTVENYRG